MHPQWRRFYVVVMLLRGASRNAIHERTGLSEATIRRDLRRFADALDAAMRAAGCPDVNDFPAPW